MRASFLILFLMIRSLWIQPQSLWLVRALATSAKQPCNRGTVSVSRRKQQSHGAEREANPKQEEDDDDDDSLTFSLSYRIFRPMALSSRQAAPVVAIHGGPSLPSDYMEPLAEVIPYRAIVLYDGLGCGDSDEPTNPELYSVDYAVDDLETLLNKLGIRRFHLYCHSFGGMIGYEYLKRVAEREGGTDPKQQNNDGEGCLSVVLSSSPTSIPVSLQEWDRLLSILGRDNKSIFSSSVNERFRITHQCRTPVFPEPLARAYQKAGSTWAGLDVVAQYELSPPAKTAARMPSAMILRGEHDFTTEKCTRDWKARLFNHNFVRERVLEGCSHHGLLEKGSMYGAVLESFFAEYD